MVFSSISFLCLFLPATLLLSRVLPGIRAKNILLATVSLLFYAVGQLQYLPLLLASAAANYCFGLLLREHARHRKVTMTAAVVINLGILGFFKYLAFFTQTMNSLFAASLSVSGLALPIGISFFTFQGLSYVIDVYRDPKQQCASPLDLLLYISFFPQLIAGPIVKYLDIAPQLRQRKTSAVQTAQGLRRFILGLAKKLLIANTLGAAADAVFSLSPAALSCPLAWLGAVSYTLQIYFDFSGYSDMALGLGRMFGFCFRENFLHPYASGSLTEFWRRWHISLSAWFRDYLYIPLGGSRKGRARTWCNKLLVFFCTGLWHGANWTFVLWGLWHGALVSLETLGVIPVEKLNKSLPGRALCHCYTLLAVMLGFVLFRADTLGQAWTIICGLFSAGARDAQSALTLAQLLTPATMLAMASGALLALPLLPWLQARLAERERLCRAAEAVSYPLCLALLALCLCALAGSEFNPFIYFQF